MIEGQVAAIIDARELAINRGSNDGVQVGMKFEVLEKQGEPITDPETGERLGSITLVKIRVQVTAVEPKFSIASTYETVGGSGLTFAALMNVTPPRVRTLKTDEAITDPLTEAESYVKRGDPVRQIMEGTAVVKIANPTEKAG